MAHAELLLRESGCPKINLQITRDNASVVDFYRKFGFVIEDRISMGKRIVTASRAGGQGRT